MILQALNDYYLRLDADPDIELVQAGFSRQKIAFEVILEQDGRLTDIGDLRDSAQSVPVPRSLIVPGQAKPSGSGINPGLLWDNTGYMLGVKPDDPKPERTQKSHEAFRAQHFSLEESIKDTGFSAVCRFLGQWTPCQATDYPLLSEITSGFGVFRIRGRTEFVHESKSVQAWWQSQLVQQDTDDSTIGQCLVTGEIAAIARLHEPKIKGVRDAQSSGASLVSFNYDAFESFGRKQSRNAPVSQAVAFQYCVALNHLLRHGSGQRLQIGDATTVFWTEKPTAGEESFLPFVFETTGVEDSALKIELAKLLQRVARGEYPRELGDPESRFFMLGLSPNAARLSIRFWFTRSLGQLVNQLRDHFHDLAIEPMFDRDPEFPALWQLLAETSRESKDIPPLLAGALMQAVLNGTPYPQMLFSAVIRRIRADRRVNRVRAGILKACLNRNSRAGRQPLETEIPMALDPDRPEPAYQTGRLFAVLEKTQEDALSVNKTIKDRYFSAASATPATVFPRLIRLHQHHLSKLDTPKRIYHERLIQDITAHIDSFQTHLTLQEQGLFVIGYYHQRKSLFTKSVAVDTTDTDETSTDAQANSEE